ASFLGPSCKRFSSRWIFFLKFFNFIMVLLLATEGELTIRFRVNDKIELLSRSYHNENSASACSSMHHAQPRSESRALFYQSVGIDAVRTSGPFSVTSTLSSMRTPPQPM